MSPAALPGLLLAAIAVLSGCGPEIAVHAERSMIATFARYDTYRWASPAVAARGSAETQAAMIDWRIHDAVDRWMASKGYVRTEGAASLLVDYDVAVRERNTDSFGEFFEYRRRGGQLDMGEAFVAGYQEGTLVLQMVDTRTREIAYRAWASAALEHEADGRRVDEAVARMLKDLPQAGGTGR